MNILVAHENMDDKTAYNIVKTIFDQQGRHRRACTRKRTTSSSRARRRRRRRSRSTRARSSTSPKRASRSTEPRRRASGHGGPAEAIRDERAVRASAPRRCNAPSSTSRKKKARPTAEGLARRLHPPRRRRRCRRSTSTPPTRSCRRRCCGRSTSPSCCSSASWSFRSRKRFRHRVMWWDWLAAALAHRGRRLPDPGRRRLHRPQHLARTPGTSSSASALIVLVLEAMRRTSGWIMPVDHARLPRLRALRPVPAGAVDAQGLRGRPPGRLTVHDARRHLRRRRRRRPRR